MLKKFYQTGVCIGVVLGLVYRTPTLMQMARYNGIRATITEIRGIARRAYAEMLEEVELEFS